MRCTFLRKPVARPHLAAACAQVLEPVQFALLLIQSETDPIEGMHIANMVALQRGVPDAPPLVARDTEIEEELMRPYLPETIAAALAAGVPPPCVALFGGDINGGNSCGGASNAPAAPHGDFDALTRP